MFLKNAKQAKQDCGPWEKEIPWDEFCCLPGSLYVGTSELQHISKEQSCWAQEEQNKSWGCAEKTWEENSKMRRSRNLHKGHIKYYAAHAQEGILQSQAVNSWMKILGIR
jgi:hypothetical protein